MSGTRRNPRPSRSPLTGGRRRSDDPSGRRFVLLLVLILALTALGLWAIERAGAAGSPRARALAVVQREFGAGPLAACMFAIVGRETGYTYDPAATNWRDHHSDGSRGSFGLFQIGAVHRAAGESVAAFRSRMLEPRRNARAAHALERGAGLAPWGGFC
jgi:hypothetical protein